MLAAQYDGSLLGIDGFGTKRWPHSAARASRAEPICTRFMKQSPNGRNAVTSRRRRRLRSAFGSLLPSRAKSLIRRSLGINEPQKPQGKREVVVDLVDGVLCLDGTIRRKNKRVGAVVTVSRKTKRQVRYPCESQGGFSARIDLTELAIDAYVDSDVAADVIDLWLEMVPTKQNGNGQNGDANSATAGKLERIGRFRSTKRPLREVRTTAADTEFLLDITDLGNLSIVVGDAYDKRRRIKVSTTSLQREAGELHVQLDLECQDRTAVTAHLVALGRDTQSRVEMPLELVVDQQATQARGGLLIQQARGALDLETAISSMPAQEGTLDISYCITDAAGNRYEKRLNVPSATGRRVLAARWVHRDGWNHHLVPYRTYRAENLSFRVDRFTPEQHAFLLWVMRLGWIAPVLKPFTRIWLIGEVPYKAQDNGFQFFKYLRTQKPRRRAYYVIDEASPDLPKVEAHGNVVLQHTKKHILYSVLASRLIGSHHSEYLLPTRDPRLQRWARGVRVFLQHGPTAQKNVVPVYGRQTSQERPAEKFLVTSDLEKRIVVEDYGYRPHQVAVTGFARFDALLTEDIAVERTILIMPTWREGLAREQAFLSSDYYHAWHGFLTSPELASMLKQSEVRVTFILHPNMRNYEAHFRAEGVNLVRQEEVDVQRLLKSSSMLITDYSSVAWDFSYQNRPVLYYQFDRGAMVGAREPHIDFDEGLPGPISTTVDELVERISAAVAQDFAMEPEYMSRSRSFLKYQDRSNCARINRAIASAWSPLTAFERMRNADWAQHLWRKFRKGKWYFPTMKAMNRVVRHLPRSNVVLFECDRGSSYGDSPRYIYERLIERDHNLKIVWANNSTIRFTDPNTRKVVRLSPTYWWIASRAKYWVTNQNMNADLRPGRRTQYLQTWHGTPLKKMQHDVPVMAGRDADYHIKAARLTSYWNSLISPSSYATAAFRSAFRYQGPVLEVGYPRNDPLVRAGREKLAERARTRLGLENDDRKVILYAPTFRDDQRKGRHWRHELALDIDELEARLGDQYVLLVRYHQLVRNPLPARHRSSDFVKDASKYPDIQELLLAADLLVTDYSSVFFDYAVLERPMVFFAYDLESYQSELRGFYLDYERSVPGPVVRSSAELADVISNYDQLASENVDRVRDFKRVYNPMDDGNASDRVIDELFQGVKHG